MKPLDPENAFAGYVYMADVMEDLMELVFEYIGEAEHQGSDVNYGEVSKDTVGDMKAFCEMRKEKLQKDFIAYWSAAD